MFSVSGGLLITELSCVSGLIGALPGESLGERGALQNAICVPRTNMRQEGSNYQRRQADCT